MFCVMVLLLIIWAYIMRIPIKPGMWTFLLLSFTVGYCDTITFFTSGFFAVHVLANIIFSAYQMLHDGVVRGLLSLLSIPVYLGALLSAKRIVKSRSKRADLIKAAGTMLIITGLLSAILTTADILKSQVVCFLIAFLVVAAMGIISAARSNLTPAFLIGETFMPAFWSHATNLKNQGALLVLAGFAMGCLAGAAAGNFVGLSGVILPGVLLFLFTMND